MTTQPALREVDVFRAQGVVSQDAVSEVVIRIQHPMPDVPSERSRAFFASEAAAIADAIWSSCPGGTVDALIVALMSRRASILRVPLTQFEATA